MFYRNYLILKDNLNYPVAISHRRQPRQEPFNNLRFGYTQPLRILQRGETAADVIAVVRRAVPAPLPVFIITGDPALAPAFDDQVELFAKPLAPEVLRAALGKIAAGTDTAASEA